MSFLFDNPQMADSILNRSVQQLLDLLYILRYAVNVKPPAACVIVDSIIERNITVSPGNVKIFLKVGLDCLRRYLLRVPLSNSTIRSCFARRARSMAVSPDPSFMPGEAPFCSRISAASS